MAKEGWKSISIRGSLYDLLDALAKKHSRSLSAEIEYVFKTHPQHEYWQKEAKGGD